MRAMVLERPGRPVEQRSLPVPEPGAREVLLRVEACAVCRTDLHIVDGELPDPVLPLVPGHEIVGRVEAMGSGCSRFSRGQRVGVPWLGRTCGRCRYCRSGRENLCADALFTGYQLAGGYAEYTLAHEDFCFAIPDDYDAVSAAPLLCAGLIGHRTWAKAETLMKASMSVRASTSQGSMSRERSMASPASTSPQADAAASPAAARRIGVYGFGAAAHIVAQILRHQQAELYAFTRPGDDAAQSFARELGAVWAGGSDTAPPETLDAALIFAPTGGLVPAALAAVAPGGCVVCGGIHMSDIPAFPYALLWGERTIASVANLTRADGEAFLALAPRVPVRTTTTVYPLENANEALDDLRAGRVTGAAVLVP